MKTLKLKTVLPISEIKASLKSSKNTVEFKRWQCLYMISTMDKVSADYLSDVLCLSKPTIYSIVQKFNKQGKISVKPKLKGGRKRSLLSWEQEVEVMNSLTEEAKQGKLITANAIRKSIEEKVGKKVSDDFLWDLFHRHGWKKKKPRPVHPKSNKQLQDDFKKNSRMIWTPFA